MLTHIVAKTLIFNDDGKLLKIRRSVNDSHRPGGSDIPGGKIDDGEEIVVGAVREIFEEVGVKIHPSDMQLSFAYAKAGYNTDAKGTINIVWLGFIVKLPKDQDVTLSHEHEDYAWLTIEEALLDNDSNSMTKFLEYIKTNEVAKELWDVTSKGVA